MKRNPYDPNLFYPKKRRGEKLKRLLLTDGLTVDTISELADYMMHNNLADEKDNSKLMFIMVQIEALKLKKLEIEAKLKGDATDTHAEEVEITELIAVGDTPPSKKSKA